MSEENANPTPSVVVSEPTPVAVVEKPRKARKPKTARKVKVQEPLRLGLPTRLDGAKDDTLVGTMKRKYAKIEYLTPDGKKVHAVVHAKGKGEKVDNVGSGVYHFTLALINGALAGQGQGPDGCSIWVTQEYPKIERHFGKKFGDYILRLTPDGRAGAERYEGKVAQFLAVCRAKAELVAYSLKKHGSAKIQVRENDPAEAVPTVVF